MSQMRRIRKFGLVLLAAASLAAVGTATAQAGEFTLNGGSFTSKGLASESIAGTLGEGKLLVPEIGITFKCTGATFNGTVLLGGTAHVGVLFSGCEVEGNKFCKTFETKANMESETQSGFLSASGLGELVLMGGNHYLLASSGASPFSTIYLTKSAKGCTLPLEEVVVGSTVFALPNALTPSVVQTAATIPQTELESLFPNDKLKYGLLKAWLDGGGSITAQLTGALNKGKPWGGE